MLLNSLYNLQASALFVLGEPWVVLRAYVLHVMLLALGTVLLTPALGIMGYGGAEVLACAAYSAFHLGANQMAWASYRKLSWFVLAFLTPVFGLLVRGGWRFALWIPVILVAGDGMWSWIKEGLSRSSESRTPAVASMAGLNSEFSDT